MLDGVETGYEGKFDFPGRRPEIAYMLATVPRTGSSWLSHVLWQTGCLGAPLEYLNFDKDGPYFFAHDAPDQQDWLWRSVLQRRTSPNGVFGVKCFPMQLEALHQGNPRLLNSIWSTLLPAGRPGRIVYLGRRDRTAHAISYARATISGIWRKEQEAGGRAEPEYSEAALATAGQWIDMQASGWEEMFRNLRIEPLRLWYEDVAASPGEAARQVADYLGVAIDAAASVRIPAVEKQSAEGSRAWAERHAQTGGDLGAAGR
jgi:LPS sulfotransferase NodH